MIETVLLDGDDTIWHNEPLFAEMTERFLMLLAPYHSSDWIQDRLFETEVANLRYYGYGIKSFVLSMVETAVELTEGRIGGSEISVLLEYGKEMLEAPVALMEHAEQVVKNLAENHKLILVTKGDLFDQESKLARSGLADCFDSVEIVSEKTEATYAAIAGRNGIDIPATVMVGDSLKSDVLPIAKLGGTAIHVPYGTTWKHESVAEEILKEYEYLTATHILHVPKMIRELSTISRAPTPAPS